MKLWLFCLPHQTKKHFFERAGVNKCFVTRIELYEFLMLTKHQVVVSKLEQDSCPTFTLIIKRKPRMDSGGWYVRKVVKIDDMDNIYNHSDVTCP